MSSERHPPCALEHIGSTCKCRRVQEVLCAGILAAAETELGSQPLPGPSFLQAPSFMLVYPISFNSAVFPASFCWQPHPARRNIRFPNGRHLPTLCCACILVCYRTEARSTSSFSISDLQIDQPCLAAYLIMLALWDRLTGAATIEAYDFTGLSNNKLKWSCCIAIQRFGKSLHCEVNEADKSWPSLLKLYLFLSHPILYQSQGIIYPRYSPIPLPAAKKPIPVNAYASPPKSPLDTQFLFKPPITVLTVHYDFLEFSLIFLDSIVSAKL